MKNPITSLQTILKMNEDRIQTAIVNDELTTRLEYEDEVFLFV